jgi:two-component system, LytTR family, response regulator
MMIKLSAMVVDDEPKAVRNMVALLGYFPFVDIVGTAHDAEAARVLLHREKPDLLFLDIQMPAETGFDLLASLQERPFEVVFVTAYHEFALKAFKVNALDYLIKPVDIDDLETTLRKVQARKKEGPEARRAHDAAVDKTLHSLATEGRMDKLLVPHLTGFRLVELEKIVYLEADGNYTVLHLIDFQKIVVSKQLGHLELLLSEAWFFRIHKSSIINLRHVEGFASPTQEVNMCDGAQLTVSRRRLDEFQTRIAGISR